MNTPSTKVLKGFPERIPRLTQSAADENIWVKPGFFVLDSVKVGDMSRQLALFK
jgi:hypothetical protein